MVLLATGLLEGMQKLAVWKEMISGYDRQFLWDKDIPDWDDSIEQEKPSIAFFKSEKARENTGCVLVIPGGKYLYKSTNEAVNVAKKFNDSGIDAAVLDYRVVPYARDTILKDAKRAIRFLRFNAKKYGFDEDKIAVLGFSAGGNLASLCALYGDDGDQSSPDPIERMSSRPNAAVFCYSAINVVDEYDDDEEFSLISYFDVVFDREYKHFPPSFIWQSMSDGMINYKTSLELATVLNEMNVPVEMHLFPYGDHGQGLADTKKGEINKGDNYLASCWSDLCVRWLKNYGF